MNPVERTGAYQTGDSGGRKFGIKFLGLVIVDTALMRHARLKRRVKAWSWSLNDFMAASLNSRVRMVMITLTYRPGVEWEPQHMNVFMRHVRKSNGIGLLGYAWVAELQQRGAVHFHLLLLVTRGSVIPMPDRCGWGAGRLRASGKRRPPRE